MLKPNMKNTNTSAAVMTMPRTEFDHIGQLLETIQSQAELIARLTSERNERIRRETFAMKRRTEVFRIPIQS